MAHPKRPSRRDGAAVNVSVDRMPPILTTTLAPRLDDTSVHQVGGPLALGTPITERLLRRLPGPRNVLITLWAAGVMVTPFVLAGAKSLTGRSADFNTLGELAPQAILTYVVALLLHGVARLVDRATALRPEVERLTNEERQSGSSASGWDRRRSRGPHVGGGLGRELEFLGHQRRSSDDGRAAVLGPCGPARHDFRLDLHPTPDRPGSTRACPSRTPALSSGSGLGLGVVGSLAFGGFVLLIAAAVPTLLATTRNPTTFVIVVVILTVNVPIFFLSMWRLHSQMSGAKARHVSEARALYAAAFEPLRSNASVAVLRRQASVLEAARALEERAERIQAWPINEGLMAIMGFIVAGVTSGIVVRLIVVAANF